MIMNDSASSSSQALSSNHRNTNGHVLDDAVLLEGHMAPVYPLGVNVILARVGGKVNADEARSHGMNTLYRRCREMLRSETLQPSCRSSP